jgi:hypothetical protein
MNYIGRGYDDCFLVYSGEPEFRAGLLRTMDYVQEDVLQPREMWRRRVQISTFG